MESNYITRKGSKNLLCAHGWVGQTQLPHSWRRISQNEIRNSVAAEKSESESEGRQKFPACRQAGFPPTPFLFARPSVRFRSCRAKRGNLPVRQAGQSGFCSKKVRASFSNCDQHRHFENWEGLDKLVSAYIDGDIPKENYLAKKEELLKQKVFLANDLEDFRRTGKNWLQTLASVDFRRE